MYDHNKTSISFTSLERRKSVQARTGLSRSHLYLLMQKGEFPRPVNISSRAVAWTSVSVDDWIARRIAASNPA